MSWRIMTKEEYIPYVESHADNAEYFLFASEEEEERWRYLRLHGINWPEDKDVLFGKALPDRVAEKILTKGKVNTHDLRMKELEGLSRFTMVVDYLIEETEIEF